MNSPNRKAETIAETVARLDRQLADLRAWVSSGGPTASHTHSHTALTGVTADQHHAKSHAHNGSDGSGTVAHSALTGITTDDHHAKDHAATHKRAGGDAIDGDQLDVDWVPTNYTRDATPAEADHVEHLTSHLYGIDQALPWTISTPAVTLKGQASDPNMGSTGTSKLILATRGKLVKGWFLFKAGGTGIASGTGTYYYIAVPSGTLHASYEADMVIGSFQSYDSSAANRKTGVCRVGDTNDQIWFRVDTEANPVRPGGPSIVAWAAGEFMSGMFEYVVQ